MIRNLQNKKAKVKRPIMDQFLIWTTEISRLLLALPSEKKYERVPLSRNSSVVRELQSAGQKKKR